jgi:hypothetical protein
MQNMHCSTSFGIVMAEADAWYVFRVDQVADLLQTEE